MPRYAALDIGSNSIRMEAAETVPGGAPRILASERDVTRLGGSVFQTGAIGEEAIQLACRVLVRMADVYRKLDVVGVRAVATSAVRDARNASDFLDRASQAIGAPVEVISGREEARLIHLGVQTRWPQPGKHVLIVDIGGGSAEIIASEDGHMRDAISKPLGAVRLSEMFLKNDPPAPAELLQMQEYIHEKLASAVRRFEAGAWDRIIATSATASAVVSAIGKVPRARRDAIDRLRAPTPEVRKLYRKLSQLSLSERRKVTGIGPRRAEIIVPGVSVLLAILDNFRQRSAYYSAAGVRDGIIAELAARGVGLEFSRLSPEQRKEVSLMSRRYGVATAHARQVAALAHTLFTDLQPLHQLPSSFGKYLEAAAYLHDIGHYVSDANHHKHSYYLVVNSDMLGFTGREREFVGNLCRYHRKSMPLASHANFQALNPDEKRALVLLIPLLRLADSLDRSHDQRVKFMECSIRNGSIVLRIASAEDTSLEQWATEQTGEVVRQVYNRPLAFAESERR
jgi:exopolyphosphatase / guanosine-5'-triphosphate,3'-diphosphate pyrophosphatase